MMRHNNFAIIFILIVLALMLVSHNAWAVDFDLPSEALKIKKPPLKIPKAALKKNEPKPNIIRLKKMLETRITNIKNNAASSPQSRINGTVQVKIKVEGSGVGPCNFKLKYVGPKHTSYSKMYGVANTSNRRFPRIITLELPHPGMYKFKAEGAQGLAKACKGQALTGIMVKPHPRFLNRKQLIKVQETRITRITNNAISGRSLLSRLDGTTTVKIKVDGSGIDSCDYRLKYNGPGNVNDSTIHQVRSSNSLPHIITVELPTPGKYRFKVGPRPNKSVKSCKGEALTTIVVRSHPKYPCGQYPGFEKVDAAVGADFYCRPIVKKPMNVKPFLCPKPGTRFGTRAEGFYFGCFENAVLDLDAIGP